MDRGSGFRDQGLECVGRYTWRYECENYVYRLLAYIITVEGVVR